MKTVLSYIKLTDLLVNCTKDEKLNWINMEIFKTFLRDAEKTLNDVDRLNKLLTHFQKDSFIFDCTNTYLAIYDESLFIFSKSKYTFLYRLDHIDLTDPNSDWKSMNVPDNLLLRLRNAIELTLEDTNDEMCIELVSSISLGSLV